jgi:DNA topoisomerase I
VPEFLDMITDAGGHLWACRMSADMNKLTKDDLYDGRRGHHQRERLHRAVGGGADAVHLKRMLALVTALLDETLLRVGNHEYLRTNGSYGLTTLEREHVRIDGSRIEFRFVGKSGQEQEFELRHPRLARQLLCCEEIPGQRMFSYEDESGWHDIDSSDLNGHLAEVAGAEVTAKDFRTWGATVVAAEALRSLGPPQDERAGKSGWLAALDAAAERLGNTRDVARSSYVDPRVERAYLAGALDDAWDDDPERRDWLSASERAVKRILEQPLRRR